MKQDTRIYCPACGEITLIDTPGWIGPGLEIWFVCSACKTEFVISISYQPIEESEDETRQEVVG